MKNHFKATNQNVKLALDRLQNHNLIIHSTDTIPGIAADATSNNAVNKVIKLKGRSGPYSIIINSIEDIKKYALINENQTKQLSQFLPGPFTILLKNNKNNNLANLTLGNSQLIGFRIPNHNFTNQLTSALNKPIITTSLNLTGEKSIIDLKSVSNDFKDLVIFDDGEKKLSKGSTILDFSQKEIKIIRQGDGEYL